MLISLSCWTAVWQSQPDQSLFIDITATQSITTGGKTKEAVKSLDFAVGPEFGTGFFDSCKDVKFGATNGFAMDLLGGQLVSFSPPRC